MDDHMLKHFMLGTCKVGCHFVAQLTGMQEERALAGAMHAHINAPLPEC
jgi:hypothetical protein